MLQTTHCDYQSRVYNLKTTFETNAICCMLSVVPDTYGVVRVHKHDSVKLPCRVRPTAATNITWLQTSKSSYGEHLQYNIYINDRIHEGLRRRFSIHDATVGDYTLTMLNVHSSDGGRYQCFDQQQLLQNYVIFVTGL